MAQSALMEKENPAVTQKRDENRLVTLATPLYDVIMQMKAGLLAASNDLRRSIDTMLKGLEQEGAKLGYSESQLENTKFALAAFVDETVLAGGFSIREEWGRYPLQLEYFKEHLAGTKFFDRLDVLLKRAEAEADVIEIYYLCLLLGYKGKYHIFLEDQLPEVIGRVAEALRRVGRLRSGLLSPHWKASDQPAPAAAAPAVALPSWVKIGLAAALGLVILGFVIFTWLLNSSLSALRQELLK